jgi:hypothetical protein
MKPWTGVSMLALMMFAVAGVQAAGDVIVSVSPEVSNVGIGQTFNVSVRIDDAYLLHGSSITVRFDKTVLELVGASDGDVYTSVQPSPIFWWRPDASVHADSVLVDQAILGASVYSGSGTLFTVMFKALTAGSSAIQLWNVDLRNNNNQSIACTVRNGVVNARLVNADLKAFLQGPYTSGVMTTSLATQGIVPLTQPYSVAPWSYSGTESVASIPSGVVDWVLVELRTGTAAASKVATRAAFVKSNGAIVDLDGTSTVGFPDLAAGSYYIVVRHRNHLALMSAGSVALSITSPLFDFTTGLEKVYGGDAALLATNLYGLWAGDVTANGMVRYNQSANDRLPILQRIGGTNVNASAAGYYPEDVNMNGVVKYNQGGNDRLIILQVIGGTNVNATRSTKVPE